MFHACLGNKGYFGLFATVPGKCNPGGSAIRIKKPRRGKARPVYLSIVGVRALLDTVDNYRDRAALALSLYAGLHSGELSRLTMDDLGLDNCTVPVRDMKNGENRDMPLTREAAGFVREWLECQPLSRLPYVFMTEHDNPLGRGAVGWIAKRGRRLAGIEKNATPHKLRHTAANRVL